MHNKCVEYYNSKIPNDAQFTNNFPKSFHFLLDGHLGS